MDKGHMDHPWFASNNALSPSGLARGIWPDSLGRQHEYGVEAGAPGRPRTGRQASVGLEAQACHVEDQRHARTPIPWTAGEAKRLALMKYTG
jgi:hypothetical protein